MLGVEPNQQCTARLWRELSRACKGLYVRYGQMYIETPRNPTSPITWDTQQLAVSYVYPLRRLGPLKWLQLEWENNWEKAPTGASQIPNNIFFVELFSAF